MRDDRERLLDIEEAIDRIERNADGTVTTAAVADKRLTLHRLPCSARKLRWNRARPPTRR
jgi:hypothetical protein